MLISYFIATFVYIKVKLLNIEFMKSSISVFDLASFNSDKTSLYFNERDLVANGFDMLDISEAFPEYDFVENEFGRLVFHLA